MRLDRWAAVGLTVYSIAQHAVLSYSRRLKHIEALWFAGIANNILWWTFAKACVNALLAKVGKAVTFKATLKGVSKLAQSALGDIWLPLVTFILLATSLGIGIGKLAAGPTVITTLSISLAWMVYGMIPPFLLLHYTFIGRGTTLAFWSRQVPGSAQLGSAQVPRLDRSCFMRRCPSCGLGMRHLEQALGARVHGT